MVAAQVAENHGDERSYTWYFQRRIFTSIEMWTHKHNSHRAADVPILKVSITDPKMKVHELSEAIRDCNRVQRVFQFHQSRAILNQTSCGIIGVCLKHKIFIWFFTSDISGSSSKDKMA